MERNRNNNLLNNKLKEREYLLLDGGLATTLELDGYVLDRRLWSAWNVVTNPNSVIEVHQRFLEGGSNIITTSSYQMSYEGFYEKGLNNNEIENIFQQSTNCAKQAKENFIHQHQNDNMNDHDNDSRYLAIATSIGCYGAHLADGSEYHGNYGLSANEIQKWHEKKFLKLVNSGVDLIACETIPCIAEVQALVNLISQEIHGNSLDSSSSYLTPFEGWISFACNSGTTLNSNENVEDAIRYLTDPSYDNDTKVISSWGVGINCTNPIYVNELLDVLRDNGAMNGNRPIVVYPNKGETWNANERCWELSSGYDDILFAELSLEWKKSGANILGGCCRTTPKTISCIKNILESNNS